MKATTVFQRTYNSKQRIVINEGGSRSSKTYSIAQVFIMKMLHENNIVIDVCRKTLPALRATAMKDFFNLLENYNLYEPENHNKTKNTYKIRSNEICFFSVDESQKVRGRKRDYCWLNETNEFRFDDYKQLAMRTTKQIYMDYNPSDMESWIYDEIHTKKNVEIIK